MVPPIASQEILPGRAPESDPRLREIEQKMLDLQKKKEEKNQTLAEKKSELSAIRGNIDTLEKEGGIDTEQLTALRSSLAEIAVELEKETPMVGEVAAPEPETIPIIEKSTILQEWFPTSADPREWSAKQIASVSTLTLGIAGLFAWWRARKQRKNATEDSESKPKRGVLGKLLFWIPGIGLTVALGVAGHQMLLKYEGYAKNYQAIKKKVGDTVAWGKNQLPFVGKNIDEQHGLPPGGYELAEESYKKTLGGDLSEVHYVFGVREGEPNPSYEKFIKEMHEKYDTKIENGVTYARADVAIEHYEVYLSTALKVLGQWVTDHLLEIGVTGLVLHRTNLLKIQTILKGTGTIALQCVEISKELGKMVAKHPLISLFAAGGTLLGMKSALIAAKKLYLPENFQELGKVFEKNLPITLGEASEKINNQILSLKDHAVEFAKIGEDFTAGIRGAVVDFGAQVVDELPEAIGTTKEEIIRERNGSALDNFEQYLQYEKDLATTSGQKVSDNVLEAFEKAIECLAVFRSAFFKERLTEGSADNSCLQAYSDLENALKAAGINVILEKKDGIVRWRAGNREPVDLCVDPELTNESKIFEASKNMHQGSESSGTYVFWRAIEHLREREQQGMEKLSVMHDIAGGKALAMVFGNLLFITNPDNHEEYWVAPYTILKHLLPGDQKKSNRIADTMELTVDATLMTLSAGSFAAIKRAIIGGGPLLANPLRRWKDLIWNINPITSPLKLVQSMSRGVIDFDTFMSTGKFAESGGRYFNTIFAKGRIRPEWVGIIEHSDDLNELKRIGGQMGLGRFTGMDLPKVRLELRRHVLRILRDVELRDISNLKRVRGANYKEIYKKASEWYLHRSRFSKIAGKISKSVEILGEPVAKGIDLTKDAYTAIRSSPFIGDALKAAGETLENFLSAVSKAKMPPQLAALFAKSNGGIRMLVDAFRRAGAPGVAYITKLANCVPFAKLAGPVGVGFDAAFILLERSILEGKIQETDSAALKEFYEEQKNLTSVSLVPTAGFLALGTGPGFLLAGTYMGAKATSDYFNAATIDWLKNDKDMAKLPPGELLSKLTDIAPGQQAWNHQNAARSDSLLGGSMLEQAWKRYTPAGRALSALGLITSAEKKEVERFETVEKTNNGQRGKLTQAYLANMTEFPAQGDESEAQYAERFAGFQSEQNVFIARESQGNFGPQSPETYRKAHGHAELALLSRELTAKNTSQFIPLTHNEGSGHFVSDGEFDLRSYDDLPPFGKATAEGLTRDDVIASWLRHQEAVTMADAALTPESLEESKTSSISYRLLQSVRYELSALDAKLATADLKGWGWTGGEENSREKIRSAARGAFMDRLSTESAQLAKAADGGLDEIRQSITRLRSFLQEDIVVFVSLADKASTAASAEAGLDWRTMAAETLAA